MLDQSLIERSDTYRVLLLWQKEGTFIKESGLSPFAMELALGVCRRHLYLQYFVKSLVKKKPSIEVCTILEMGLFQMFFMDVPDHAAVSTSVELAKAANLGEGSARLVNAVLHAARRSGMPALPPQKVRRVSIENSVPEWLVRRWFDIYGAERAEALAKSTLERPSEWLRVNLQKTTAEKLATKLFVNLEGCNPDRAYPVLFDRYIQVPDGVKLKSILESQAFADGEFSLQNPAAFAVVKLLDLKPNLKVWDACAAPGGKSALMAEMEPSLEILASDASESRVEKMQDLVNRLGLANVKTACVDVLSVHSPKFDRILLDVPCSNMGVISRRPESVYRLTPESIKELAELQFRLLESASEHLAPDGIVVYATCSPDPEETTKVVARFVKEHPEFEKVGAPLFAAEEDSRLDGFFAQALRRKL